MSLSPYKTFVPGEVLTASDLNLSFLQIINNGVDLISPFTDSIDLNGNSIILDSDGDSLIRMVTNDQFDIVLGGLLAYRFKRVTSAVNGLNFTMGATGSNPGVLAFGSDTNVGIDLTPQAAGKVRVIGSANDWEFAGSAAAAAITATATGSDTDISINLVPKGAGVVKLNGISLFADALTFTGTPFKVTTTADASAVETMELESSEAGNVVGPSFSLYRSSATPAANDVIGTQRYNGKDSGGNKQTYATLFATILDPTTTSEDGQFALNLAIAGVTTAGWRWGPGQYWSTLSSQGIGTVNLLGHYINSIQAPYVVDRTGTLLDVNTTNALTTFYTFTVPILGANSSVRITVRGQYLNNDGAGRTLTLTVEHGGATMWADVSASITNNSLARPFEIDLLLFNENSTSVQGLNGTVRIGNIVAAATGFGDLATAGLLTSSLSGVAGATDTTATSTFTLSVTHSASSANLSIKRQYAMAEVMG